jgi:hypothetical protein
VNARSILGAITDWFHDRIGMSRADRALWESCRTLDDLGKVTALWLEGRIGSRPGYQPRCGPDEETTDLIPTLALLNRAGFVTAASRPGVDHLVGIGGRIVRQRAAVEGFTGEANLYALHEALRGTRFRMHVISPDSVNPVAWDGVPVTTFGGQPFTAFGRLMDYSDIELAFDTCTDTMLSQLWHARQVTIYDPQWGSNDLWPALALVVLDHTDA